MLANPRSPGTTIKVHIKKIGRSHVVLSHVGVNATRSDLNSPTLSVHAGIARDAARDARIAMRAMAARTSDKCVPSLC